MGKKKKQRTPQRKTRTAAEKKKKRKSSSHPGASHGFDDDASDLDFESATMFGETLRSLFDGAPPIPKEYQKILKLAGRMTRFRGFEFVLALNDFLYSEKKWPFRLRDTLVLRDVCEEYGFMDPYFRFIALALLHEPWVNESEQSVIRKSDWPFSADACPAEHMSTTLWKDILEAHQRGFLIPYQVAILLNEDAKIRFKRVPVLVDLLISVIRQGRPSLGRTLKMRLKSELPEILSIDSFEVTDSDTVHSGIFQRLSLLETILSDLYGSRTPSALFCHVMKRVVSRALRRQGLSSAELRPFPLILEQVFEVPSHEVLLSLGEEKLSTFKTTTGEPEFWMDRIKGKHHEASRLTFIEAAKREVLHFRIGVDSWAVSDSGARLLYQAVRSLCEFFSSGVPSTYRKESRLLLHECASYFVSALPKIPKIVRSSSASINRLREVASENYALACLQFFVHGKLLPLKNSTLPPPSALLSSAEDAFSFSLRHISEKDYPGLLETLYLPLSFESRKRLLVCATRVWLSLGEGEEGDEWELLRSRIEEAFLADPQLSLKIRSNQDMEAELFAGYYLSSLRALRELHHPVLQVEMLLCVARVATELIDYSDDVDVLFEEVSPLDLFSEENRAKGSISLLALGLIHDSFSYEQFRQIEEIVKKMSRSLQNGPVVDELVGQLRLVASGEMLGEQAVDIIALASRARKSGKRPKQEKQRWKTAL